MARATHDHSVAVPERAAPSQRQTGLPSEDRIVLRGHEAPAATREPVVGDPACQRTGAPPAGRRPRSDRAGADLRGRGTGRIGEDDRARSLGAQVGRRRRLVAGRPVSERRRRRAGAGDRGRGATYRCPDPSSAGSGVAGRCAGPTGVGSGPGDRRPAPPGRSRDRAAARAAAARLQRAAPPHCLQPLPPPAEPREDRARQHRGRPGEPASGRARRPTCSGPSTTRRSVPTTPGTSPATRTAGRRGCTCSIRRQPVAPPTRCTARSGRWTSRPRSSRTT